MFLCFDIGGTNIKSCLTGIDGKCLDNTSVRTPETYEEILQVIKTIAATTGDFDACAVAVPGTCSPDSGEILFCPNLTCLNNRNIRDDLEDLLHRPVFIENDANLAALGEYYYIEKITSTI